MLAEQLGHELLSFIFAYARSSFCGGLDGLSENISWYPHDLQTAMTVAMQFIGGTTINIFHSLQHFPKKGCLAVYKRAASKYNPYGKAQKAKASRWGIGFQDSQRNLWQEKCQLGSVPRSPVCPYCRLAPFVKKSKLGPQP